MAKKRAKAKRKPARRKKAPGKRKAAPRKKAQHRHLETSRRARVRRVVYSPFTIAIYTSGSGRKNSASAIYGIVTDVSLAGVGLILEQPLKAGTSVRAFIRGDNTEGEVTGTIAWCRAVAESWRAGLDCDLILEEHAGILKAIFEDAQSDM
jgi:hypothetical protein